MTAADLIKFLAQFPPDAQVLTADPCTGRLVAPQIAAAAYVQIPNCTARDDVACLMTEPHRAQAVIDMAREGELQDLYVLIA